MTKEQYVEKYTYGLKGQDLLPFYQFVALLEDLVERACGATVALAADLVGKAIIGVGDGYVEASVTNDVNDILHLPAVADVEVGHSLRGQITTTGCKIRVNPDDNAVIYLNNVNTTHLAAALDAGSKFEATLIDATHWVLIEVTANGTVSNPTPA